MKLKRKNQIDDDTLEDYYADLLQESVAGKNEPYIAIAQRMLQLVRELQQRHIGFDTTITTSHDYLIFAPIAERASGQITISPTPTHYNIIYQDHIAADPYDSHIRTSTPSAEDAASLLAAGLAYAARSQQPMRAHHAQIAWAIDEQPDPATRTQRLPLAHIPAQQWDASSYYQQLVGSGDPARQVCGRTMIALVNYIETHHVALPAWSYTHGDDLIFTATPDQGAGVAVEAFRLYTIRMLLRPQDAIWPGAYRIAYAATPAQAVQIIQHAAKYL